MQNLESVALKMTELCVLLYLCTFFVLFVLLYFCNLFGLSIRTSMQNLESVAQKMAELLHYDVDNDIICSTPVIINTSREGGFFLHFVQTFELTN